MLEIGPLTHPDLPAALRLSGQAGWNQVEGDWSRLLDLWPGGCLAGRVEGRLVATATLAVYSPGWAWVGMVLVDEACRGRGYGGQIMDAILAKAAELGAATLGLDATDAGRPIYARRGFQDIAGIDRRRLAGAARRMRDDEDDLLSDGEWAGVLELDRSAVAVDRSLLLARLRQSGGGRIVRRAGRLTAFGFRRPGLAADQIGPVVAESVADAAAILRSLSTARRFEPARDLLLDTPRGGAMDEWLNANQFAVSRQLTRMVRGPADGQVLSGPSVYAIAGLELG